MIHCCLYRLTLATTWNALEQVSEVSCQTDTQVGAEGGLGLTEGSHDGAAGDTEETVERQRDRETGLPICFFSSSLPKFLQSNPVLTVAFLPGRDLRGCYLTKPTGAQPETVCQRPRTEKAATFRVSKNHCISEQEKINFLDAQYHLVMR